MTARAVRRRWASRIGAAVSLWVVVVGVAVFLGNQPDALLLGLLIAACAASLWLYLDTSTAVEAPRWRTVDDDPVRPPGEDRRLAMLTRVLRGHADAREVGNALRAHVLELADQRLLATHGVSRRADPERAAGLLGPELTALADQQPPYPRLTPHQIDVLLNRIEDL